MKAQFTALLCVKRLFYEPVAVFLSYCPPAKVLFEPRSLHTLTRMAPAMSTRRSRSPRRDLVASSAASGLLRELDVEKMQLQLGVGCVSKVLYFADDDIWFEAKPLVLYLDYSPTHVTQTLGLVRAKNKKSLQELLEAKGSPKWVDLSDRSTPGYHDLKASYVNEPGLYSLIFKSTKQQAQDFQDWVYEEVLTALRRRGSYSLAETELPRNLLVILQKRDQELQVVLQKQQEEWQLALDAALDASLGRRDERILNRLAQQCEQLSVSVVFAMQRAVAASLASLVPLKGLASSVSLSMRGAVKDVIDAAVTSADSKLVKAFRAATKAPAKRSSSDAAKFPVSQRATPKQKVEALSLPKVACEEFPANDLHYNTWVRIRSEFGKRAKAERLRRHGLGVASPDFEPQPLLWCTGLVDGCKERYLYLDRHRGMLRAVWHDKPPFGQSLHDWAVELQAAAKAETGYVQAEWPEDAAELEVFG